LSKNQLALYFYNNSNNVAILLPRRASNPEKWLKIRLFIPYEITPTRCLKLYTVSILFLKYKI
ncbi:MAG: hypothetical protein MR300_06600, partial [Ruminococcus sp.]|nr:hypothetical protein [Ruminococcus sp.]